MEIVGLDHVQLAMPAGGEATARAFYGGVLALPEVAKPPALAARGGCWFRAGTAGLHLGVERVFQPARKAHPGLAVRDLDGLLSRLRAGGYAVTEDADVPGQRRCHARDPFGNRLEFIEAEP